MKPSFFLCCVVCKVGEEVEKKEKYVGDEEVMEQGSRWYAR